MSKLTKYFFTSWLVFYLIGVFMTFDFQWPQMIASQPGTAIIAFSIMWFIACMLGALFMHMFYAD